MAPHESEQCPPLAFRRIFGAGWLQSKQQRHLWSAHIPRHPPTSRCKHLSQRSAALRGAGLLNLCLAPPSAMMSVDGRARGREVGSIQELSSYNTTETSTA